MSTRGPEVRSSLTVVDPILQQLKQIGSGRDKARNAVVSPDTIAAAMQVVSDAVDTHRRALLPHVRPLCDALVGVLQAHASLPAIYWDTMETVALMFAGTASSLCEAFMAHAIFIGALSHEKFFTAKCYRSAAAMVATGGEAVPVVLTHQFALAVVELVDHTLDVAPDADIVLAVLHLCSVCVSSLPVANTSWSLCGSRIQRFVFAQNSTSHMNTSRPMGKEVVQACYLALRTIALALHPKTVKCIHNDKSLTSGGMASGVGVGGGSGGAHYALTSMGAGGASVPGPTSIFAAAPESDTARASTGPTMTTPSLDTTQVLSPARITMAQPTPAKAPESAAPVSQPITALPTPVAAPSADEPEDALPDIVESDVDA